MTQLIKDEMVCYRVTKSRMFDFKSTGSSELDMVLAETMNEMTERGTFDAIDDNVWMENWDADSEDPRPHLWPMNTGLKVEWGTLEEVGDVGVVRVI